MSVRIFAPGGGCIWPKGAPPLNEADVLGTTVHKLVYDRARGWTTATVDFTVLLGPGAPGRIPPEPLVHLVAGVDGARAVGILAPTKLLLPKRKRRSAG